MTESPGRGPGVVIPPPLFFVAGFVVGWVLDRYIASFRPALSPALETLVEAIGVFLAIAGVCIAFWGIATFRRMNTAIFPNRDASRLVVAGPYQRTRNPMYSGMTLAYVGVCLIFSAGWSLLMLPLVLIALYRFVVAHEERYLTAAFGDEYRQYQGKVGRWW